LPALIAAIILGVLAMIPTLPARAHVVQSPPFELRFPQESQITEFTSTFGTRRSSGRRHRGNDLMAPKMTQVYAAGPGVVMTVAESPSAGRYVQIEHREGWTTMYIHLNDDNPATDDGKADWSLTVAAGIEEGTWVRAGQLIGWVGDSGNAEGTAPHTHFELAHEGSAIDPHDYLTEAHERDQGRYLRFVARPRSMS
jgi:murein DD-endopeptidase MepM/ murein hydrolase activator NlpD